ncbi:hypothetical protein MA9V1_048 [Chryseobacterium phage MA9V-1]|nr:hypothetical protein MA9V1_048 [Chryseobacterium phage MA9V-1]
MIKRLITAIFGKAPEAEEKPRFIECRIIKTNSKGIATKIKFIAPVKYTQMKTRKIKQEIATYFIGSGYH